MLQPASGENVSGHARKKSSRMWTGVLTGPGDFGTESSECLDEDGSLDGPVRGADCISPFSPADWTSRHSHVEAANNAGALERLAFAVLGSEIHET